MPQSRDRYALNIDNKIVDITHPTKTIWSKKNILKLDYLKYLIELSDFMLPYLKDRTLTVIRYPNGIDKESFYQKNCPDYAPNYVETHLDQDIDYIICSNLATLIWLGNHNSIEFHVPFNTIYTNKPSEIVFDLDPPSRNHFHLALEAAFLIKDIFDKLELESLIKTSGNKGLQVYIPLPENTFNYNETRQFTEFIAQYLINKEPNLFTVERLKKNRKDRLYIDYLQHSEGKTIIAPYSLRGNEEALVATPLFWDEINASLSPEKFTMEYILTRIKTKGCPFKDYKNIKEKQPFAQVILGLSSL
ncbi:non-homologous end-joining DNA ligase [Serpentinicella sp. ANB-PHB4]|uniref:non-homologous end-joining DNA ligase n=1 Tax=Serpentinicella sp. ANB-PHB4 TaxID=3074076 RepID=UPI00285FBF5D|nr:non-homologous end-joining DNA ligase [Serpentinicella sp. ANB-PHB4]MDR5659039.1 non-homologous end-joining DNA ligase [Serpentinicella sp. ANB-PHB4]